MTISYNYYNYYYKDKYEVALRQATIERDAANDTVEGAKAKLRAAKSSAKHWQRLQLLLLGSHLLTLERQ